MQGETIMNRHENKSRWVFAAIVLASAIVLGLCSAAGRFSEAGSSEPQNYVFLR